MFLWGARFVPGRVAISAKGFKGINEPPPSRGEAFSNSSAQHNTRDRLVLGPISFFGLFVTRPSLSYFIFQQKIISLD